MREAGVRSVTEQRQGGVHAGGDRNGIFPAGDVVLPVIAAAHGDDAAISLQAHAVPGAGRDGGDLFQSLGQFYPYFVIQ